MQTEVESLNSYTKKLIVRLTADDLKPLKKKLIREYQKEANIPGFRRGRAPESIILQRYGNSIQQDLIEEALKQFYGRALDETEVDPVAQGKITNIDFENIDAGMVFEIEVEVEPEFELKKYKGLKVEREVVEVTDEMVEDALQHLREQFATVREMDEAKEGHILYFDAQELDESNLPLVGRKYENLKLELGSGKFDKEIEAQLIGIKPGERRTVQTEFPADPANPESEPKVTVLEIHAKRIEERELPELNDDFVKNLDDDRIETLDQLREQLRENIRRDLERRLEQTFTNRLIDELLKENPFEVPPSMVENYLGEMIEDVKKQSPDKEIQEEDVRKEYRPMAIHHIRWYFLKKKLQEAENIQVSDEEAIALIEQSPNLDEKTREQIKQNRRYLQNLKDDLLEEKIIKMLKEHAEIIEVYPQPPKIETADTE